MPSVHTVSRLALFFGCQVEQKKGSLTTLTPSTGHRRMVLANTEQLHERIEQLCARIRELETGLRTVQASVSSEPHPLLQKPAGIFQPKISNSGRTSPTTLPHSLQTKYAESDAEPEEDSFVDAFGAQ